MLCSIAAVLMVIALVGTIVSPDPTDPGPGDTIGGVALVTGLVLIIWWQALVHQRSGRRFAFGYRLRFFRAGQQAEPDALGMAVSRRITAIDIALPAALDRLTESTTTATEDDLAKAHQVRGRAVAALRELRTQSLAVDRAISSVLPPDSERLAAARQTIDQRLARAMTDCETLIKIAGTPTAADFRPRFGSAVARVHGMVGEVMPTAEPKRSSMLIRVWRAFRSQRS